MTCHDCRAVQEAEQNGTSMCDVCAWQVQEEDEEDFLTGKTCNPDAPEECESCQ